MKRRRTVDEMKRRRTVDGMKRRGTVTEDRVKRRRTAAE